MLSTTSLKKQIPSSFRLRAALTILMLSPALSASTILDVVDAPGVSDGDYQALGNLFPAVGEVNDLEPARPILELGQCGGQDLHSG